MSPIATLVDVRDHRTEPSWTAITAILLIALLAPPLIREFWLPYWEYTDQDLILAYSALSMNDGLGQVYFDHPGYTYILLLAGWFRALHALGVLSVDRLGALPPLVAGGAYDAAWTALIEAGRAFSMALGGLATLVFVATVHRLTDNRKIALIVGLGLVFSMGLGQQIRQMRTDFLSGIFAMAALGAALVAARLVGAAATRRSLLVGVGGFVLAGALAALSVVTKVQGLFLCMALPVLVIALGQPSKAQARVGGGALFAIIVLAVVAVGLVAYPLSGLVGAAVCTDDIRYRAFGIPISGLYQAAIVAWPILAAGVYARVWRVPASTALAVTAALFGGLALGVAALWIVWAPCNAIAFSNPLEHMLVFSTWRHASELGTAGAVSDQAIGALVGQGILRTLAIRTVIFHPDRLPQTLIFEWWVIAGIVVAWRRGCRPVALQAALLLLTAWGLEAIFNLRGLQRGYAIYTEPLVLLASAFLLARLSPVIWAWPRRWLAASLVVFVIAAQAWPITYLYRRNPDPRLACSLVGGSYMPRLPGFPMCAGLSGTNPD